MPWLMKAGANIAHLHPEIRRLERPLCVVFESFGLRAVVTSGNDGQHKVGSLHYQNLAIDLRVHMVGAKMQTTLLATLSGHLELLWPRMYDVLLEGMGTDNAHIHVESSDRLLAKLGIAKEVTV